MSLGLVSPLLAREGFAHAFFGREGGVSVGPFASLDFATNTGDDPEHVRENFRRAALRLGVDAGRVFVVSQVHGRDVVALAGDEGRDEVARREGDAVASLAGDLACGVRVADCVPVLVGDRVSGGVVAIHSGWQGTEKNVVAAGVAALRSLAGVAGSLVAAIGPCIERCCFEVGDDVAARLERASRAEGVVERVEGRRPHVDLRPVVRAQLVAEGVDDAAIDDVAGCTRCDASRFFSFRRDGKVSGRMLAAIVARPRRA